MKLLRIDETPKINCPHCGTEYYAPILENNVSIENLKNDSYMDISTSCYDCYKSFFITYNHDKMCVDTLYIDDNNDEIYNTKDI